MLRTPDQQDALHEAIEAMKLKDPSLVRESDPSNPTAAEIDLIKRCHAFHIENSGIFNPEVYGMDIEVELYRFAKGLVASA